jgi:hypothetical protein
MHGDSTTPAGVSRVGVSGLCGQIRIGKMTYLATVVHKVIKNWANDDSP